MNRYRTCCVKDCEDITSTRHCFPNPRKDMQRFKLWVEACNNKELNNLSPDKIHSVKKICHIHFSKKHRGSNNYILPKAVPTLFLPINQEIVKQPPQKSEESSYFIQEPDVKEDPLIVDEGTGVQHEEMPSVTQGIGQSEMIGFNDVIFNNLKRTVEKLRDYDKYCVLMFDRTPIQSHLGMNIDVGNVLGFQQEKASNVIADILTIFMIKGITKRWKQPVFYGFSANGMKMSDLARALKEVIKKCQECGLRVVSTICDQASSNVAVINYLYELSAEEALGKGKIQEEFTFNVDGKKIIPLYDPPHLIKGIRNNLLTRDLIWEKGNGEKLTCKWKEIQQAYNIDKHSGEFRMMSKLNDEHIFEHKMCKNKVALATQVLSYGVAASIGMFVRTSFQAEDGTCLEKRAKETVQVILFWDELFDSCNGKTLNPRHGKTLRCAASKTSPHVAFWKKAGKNLSQMYFQKEGSDEKFIPPSLKCWISTLKGMELLVKYFLGEDASFFLPQTFNQDCLETFIGQICKRSSPNQHPGANSDRDLLENISI